MKLPHFYILLIIFITVNCSYAFSQNESSERISIVLERHNKLKSNFRKILKNWDLYNNGNSKFGINNIEAIDLLTKVLEKPSFYDSESYELLSSNKIDLDSLLFELDSFGDLMFSSDSEPFQVIKSDTATTLFLSSLMSSKIFNTIQNNARDRAREIIVSDLLEKLIIMNDIVKSEIFTHLGIGVAYGSKDFTKDANDIKSEYVFIFCDRKDILKYEAGVITEEKLINNSSIFLSDRDNRAYRKVNVYFN